MRNVFASKKVLITGHTGFKGSWLCLWMRLLGAEVYGISNNVPTVPSHFEFSGLSNEIHDFRLDINSLGALKQTVAEISPDFVFHLAAQALVKESYKDPLATWHTNTIGTANLLESLRGLQNKCVAVFITSDKCYDNVEWPWGYRETDALGGPDPYSGSKAGAELAIKSYLRSFFPEDGNLRLGIGRAGNVIGGGDWAADRIVPDAVKAWVAGDALELRNPNATRPWQHVLEPLSGYIALAMKLWQDQSMHGEAFNFGPISTQNKSVVQLVAEMSKYWSLVNWKDVSSGYQGPYESGLLKLNCDKALHYLQWLPVWGFEETVKHTSLWYKNFYEDSGHVRATSEEQISCYLRDARQKGIAWAM